MNLILVCVLICLFTLASWLVISLVPSDPQNSPDSTSIKRRKPCKYHPDSFCFVCAQFIGLTRQGESKGRSIANRESFKAAYESYFSPTKLCNQDKTWAPHFACTNCYTSLIKWHRTGQGCLPFKKPTEWFEATNHDEESGDCFFCRSTITIKCKNYQFEGTCINKPENRPANEKSPISPAATRKLHDAFNLIEKLQGTYESDFSNLSDSEDEFLPDEDEPSRVFNRATLESIVILLKLSKANARVLGSILKNLGMLEPGTSTSFRDRDLRFSRHFTEVKFEAKTSKRGIVATKLIY